MNKWRFLDNSLYLLFLVVFIYLLFFGLSAFLSINLYFIPAILLIFYLPGLILLKPFFSKIDKHINSIGLIGLIVLASLFLNCLVLVPTANLLSQNRLFVILTAIMINLLLYAISHYIIKNDRYKFASVSLKQWVPLIILTLVTFTLLLVNPYAQNADGYLLDFKKTIECGRNMLPSRRIFVDFFNYVFLLTGLDYKIIFRFIYPMLFVVSTMPLLGYLGREKNNKTLPILFLALLIPSVILSEVNIIRPQSALITCTIPSLLFSYLAIKENKWLYVFFSLAFSLLAFLFHELAFILLLTTSIAIIINMFRYYRRHKISSKEIFMFVVILLPYVYIFWDSNYFSVFYERINYVYGLFNGINFELWFIDSYKTMDGMELGWPGKMAILYYAYNGLFLLILATYLLFKFRKQINITALSPLIFYIIIFFMIAEIMPRLGFFFIPNRAWVHLMLAVATLTIIIGVEIFTEFSKSLKIFFLILIISGVGASLYVAYDNINTIYPEEKVAIQKILSLPQNATIVSSQDNESLVEIYGERNFIKINPDKQIDKDAFDLAVSTSLLNDSETAQTDEIYKEINIIKNGVVVSNDKVKLDQAPEFCETHYKIGDPVYFYYSYRKISGMNSDRNYLKKIMDVQNKDTYSTLGYETIYKDQHSLLLKLR